MKTSIIRLTIKKLLRKKAWSVLIFYLLFELILWFYINTLSDIFVAELFYEMSISILSILIITSILLSSVSDIRSEIRDNSIYMIIGKGIKRHHYYISKAISVWLFYLPVCLLSSLLLKGISYFYDASFYSFWITLLVFSLKTIVWSFIFCAIALFSDYIIAISFSLLIWLGSIFLPSLTVGSDFVLLKVISNVIVPSSSIFDDLLRADLMNQPVPYWYYFFVLIYAAIYILLMIFLTRLFWDRKEI
ncbi:MAG: hypothetical protein C0601_12475 [Candidatus Muiribacterium halophilum]|uniref:Uncharacterized protein n=1 Tax=Muiribacterium halophilum TaxID=2053465 RepID=A0A2N5ZAF8_MUIH1|nr:MAG: hypothetical protein C0601_12475 [Candidatus Muirbacterium halophilum]